MSQISRRRFGRGLVAGAAAAAFAPSRVAIAQGKGKVVVIGGGPAGATVATEIHKASRDLTVTLIEPNRRFTTCFYSNFYIGGLRALSSLTHDYRWLKRAGINVVHQMVDAIDVAGKTVRLRDDTKIVYDRLVVAPGIDFKFDGIEGYSQEVAEALPHAWKGAGQARRLRRQLVKMKDGGTVLIAPPVMPYRCPPGPYERACAIANYLKKKKPKSKVIVLDPKMNFSKQPVFEEAFKKYYADMVEVHLTNDIDDYAVTRVDTRSGHIYTKAGLTVKADVANIIPRQTAGRIALLAGLAEGDWCPIEPETFKSTKARDIYVLGDAAIANQMPKSAFSASSQARVVAADILADLAFADRGTPQFRNTCWSFLAPDDSAKIGADYAPGIVARKPALAASGSFVSQPGESAALRKENYDASLDWYETLTSEMFMKPTKS